MIAQPPIASAHFGSGIWSQIRRTAGAIFQVTVPGTMRRSACRGDARKISAPKRAMSYRGVAVAIISMAQHASPNIAGHNDDRRDQFSTWSTLVIRRFD